jgi:hypothetical protein
MKWHQSKREHMRTKKLHHRAYKRALSDLQTELAFSDPGEVVVLTGPSRMGKTSVLERLEREYLESSGNDSTTEYPFVYVEAKNRASEGRFSSKAFFSDLAEALHHPAFSPTVEDGRHRQQNISRVDRRTTADLMTACERALRHLNSRYLAIDEAQHIQWHGGSVRARTAILDSFKSFASSANVTLVLTGAYPIVGMLRASNHMVGRSSLLEMPRYYPTPEDAEEFMNLLDWFSKGIRFERGVGSLVDWAGYIHQHSLGVVGAVGRWLRIAMGKMVRDGSDVLAWKHMEEARRNDGDLASIAAEIRQGEDLLEKTPVEEPVVWSEQMQGWEPDPPVEEVDPKPKRRKLKPFEIKNRAYQKKFNK